MIGLIVALYAYGFLSTFGSGLFFALGGSGEADRRLGQHMIRMCWVWPVLLVSVVRRALKDEK